MPRLPGEPSSVEADPKMLPTSAGEREKRKSKDRERKKIGKK